ncbi:hypothetical protein H4582DRAFT_2052241 [Lactarius indigo]|nr:hypothetical protein H4582DRAFT_2052241 [Lactarius indigo]
MLISIPAFLSYLFVIGPARAQVSAPNCGDSTFAWSYNLLQQNPCLVTAYLAAVCNGGTFTLTSLLPQHYYSGPSGVDDGDSCKCNTVVYNLISACDACQGEPWIPYSTWSFNCTSATSGTQLPEAGPSRYTSTEMGIGDSWNISAARLVGDFPEVTGTVSIVPTRVSQSTLTPTGSVSMTGSLSTSAPTPTSRSRSNAGAIAGGIVGGIVGATLIGAVWSWFAIHRRRARSAPHLDFQSGKKEPPLPPYPLTEGAPKFYDPLDPTTYPSKVHLPTSNQRLGSTNHLRPNDYGYSGLPEV